MPVLERDAAKARNAVEALQEKRRDAEQRARAAQRAVKELRDRIDVLE